LALSEQDRTLEITPVESIRRCLARWTRPSERLLLAVSGGRDSMAMLTLFLNITDIKRDNLVIGFIDHQLRSDSAEDGEFVKEYANKHGVEFAARAVDVRDYCRRHHASLEAGARVLRYDALHGLAVEHGCDWILTAHTADDSAETVIMRMQSGAPWYEWTGIPERRGRVLRPLLTVTRRSVAAWGDELGSGYREDPSNTDPRFQRNALRQQLQGRADFWTDAQCKKFAEAGQDLEAVLRAEKCLYQGLRREIHVGREGGAVGLAIDKIFCYFNSLTFLPVEVEWARFVGNSDARLPSAIRIKLTEFLAGQSPDKRLRLAGNITLLRRGNCVWMLPDYSEPSIHQQVFPGIQRIAGTAHTIGLHDRDHIDASSDHSVCLRGDLLQRELYIRSRKAGDRIQCAGRPMKKLSDVLNEAKLDPVQRAGTLVLADDDGVLMILGGAVAERAQHSDVRLNTLVLSWNDD
jgi:tRNA(Ile)-lysidine synthase